MCVNGLMSIMFNETVDVAVDGKQSAEEYFEGQEALLSAANKIMRPLGIFLTVLGIYLLFSPLMATLAWIPLFGSLLSSLASFAAMIIALILGGIVACLVIGLAWVFFRPLLGVPLLAIALTGIYFVFFY